MDTDTQDSSQISLFGAEELPILVDPSLKAAPAPAPAVARVRTPKPKPTAEQIARRQAIARAAEAREKRIAAKKAFDARPPLQRRVRHRWENAYD